MLLVEKWREPLTNPYDIPFPEHIKLTSIWGYPHAGNDVFYIEIEVRIA